MRKFLCLAIAVISISINTIAQDSLSIKNDSAFFITKKKDWSKVNLSTRANDHFLIQFGYDGWAGAPDSLNITGFSRHFNFYLMYDMPFKTAPRLSVAGGLGVGSSSIFFDNTSIDIAGKNGSPKIVFANASNTNHFRKYKIAKTWAEVPIE